MAKFIYALVSVMLITAFANAQQSSSIGKIPVSPDVKTGTLPNGLRYFIRYNKKPENKVELRLAVNAGSVLEDDDQQGLAHFMEHMNFNGLKNFPSNEIIHYLQSIGVAFGSDLNAYTGFDQTVYILPVPSDKPGKLDSAFMILSDWAGGALLTPDEIEKERGVILAESRIGKGADDRMQKKYLPVMFNGSKYANRLPIGEDSIIKNFDHSVLRRFYTDWYRPGNQAVIVVGDMPVDKAEAMIKKYFSDYKDPEKPRERPAIFELKPYDKNISMVVSDHEAASTSVDINGNPHPRKPLVTEEDFMRRLRERLVSSMLNARFNEMRTSADPPFIYAYGGIGGFARGWENFSVSASCGIHGIEKATLAIVTETMRVKKYGFTEAELTRAKASMLASYERRYNEKDKMESSTLTNELINNFLVSDAIPGIAWEYEFVKANIEKINLASLSEVYKKIDIDEKYFALVTSKDQPGLPDDAALMKWVDESLKKPVEPYTEKELASSLLEKEPVAGKVIKKEKNEKLGTTTFTLSNNAIVCIKPTDFKNDEILLKAVRMGGYSLYEGEDYQSAQWSNNVIEDMGYGAFTSADLRKFLTGKNVSVIPSILETSEQIDASSTIKDIETMFQLLYLKSTNPRKDMDGFQSFITRSKLSSEQLKSDPRYLFMDTTNTILYKGNKRAHMITPADEYDRINAENAITFYNSRFNSAAGMYYVIVGSFTEEQIQPLIEKYIGGLSAKPVDTKFKDLGITTIEGKQNFTLRKGSEDQGQLSHYFTGKMPYNADDNFRLGMLNSIIRNMINDEIREKMSAIYGGGVGGSLSKFPREEFIIRSSFPCGPDNINDIDKAFMAIIENVQKDDGITDSHLQKVREPALESNRVNLKVNRYWLNSLISAYQFGNDPERIIKAEQMIKDLTTTQLIETARKFYSTPNVFKAEWLPETVR